jgi:hypothetical protein
MPTTPLVALSCWHACRILKFLAYVAQSFGIRMQPDADLQPEQCTCTCSWHVFLCVRHALHTCAHPCPELCTECLWVHSMMSRTCFLLKRMQKQLLLAPTHVSAADVVGGQVTPFFTCLQSGHSALLQPTRTTTAADTYIFVEGKRKTQPTTDKETFYPCCVSPGATMGRGTVPPIATCSK